MTDGERALHDGLIDELTDVRQRQAEAERRLAVLVIARDPAQMDALVAKAAADIEDDFARGHEGGAALRKGAVARIVRVAVDTALAGGKPEFV